MSTSQTWYCDVCGWSTKQETEAAAHTKNDDKHPMRGPVDDVPPPAPSKPPTWLCTICGWFTQQESEAVAHTKNDDKHVMGGPA